MRRGRLQKLWRRMGELRAGTATRPVLPRHTQPNDDQRPLLHQLGLRHPEQPLPRIRAQLRRKIRT